MKILNVTRWELLMLKNLKDLWQNGVVHHQAEIVIVAIGAHGGALVLSQKFKTSGTAARTLSKARFHYKSGMQRYLFPLLIFSYFA